MVPFGLRLVSAKIKAMGMKPRVRENPVKEFITDNGNLILDCAVKPIANPARLDRELLAIPGVVGTGLFIAMADIVLIAEASGKFGRWSGEGGRGALGESETGTGSAHALLSAIRSSRSLRSRRQDDEKLAVLRLSGMTDFKLARVCSLRQDDGNARDARFVGMTKPGKTRRLSR